MIACPCREFNCAAVKGTVNAGSMDCIDAHERLMKKKPNCGGCLVFTQALHELFKRTGEKLGESSRATPEDRLAAIRYLVKKASEYPPEAIPEYFKPALKAAAHILK